MIILLNILVILLFFVMLLVIFWQSSLIGSQLLGAPTVYSSDQAIVDAFKLADLKSGERVLDLGCGNGKSLIIAAKKFGAKGVGIERSLYCFLVARWKVFVAGENNNIQIIYGDLKKSTDLIRKADVVYLYLLNSVLAEIEPKIFSNIKKDARIVSLAFNFVKHEPLKKTKTRTLGRDTCIYLYK